MNSAASTTTKSPAVRTKIRPVVATGKIQPIVIYPCKNPGDYSDLEALYGLVARLQAEEETYGQPITVIDRKTHYSMEGNKSFLQFRKGVVGKHSEIIDA